MPLAESITKAVAGLELTAADQGAAALAVRYAQELDAGGELDKVGPLLLAVLESLLMTPRSRAAAVKGGTGVSPPRSPLDELRARREYRERDAETVDPAGS